MPKTLGQVVAVERRLRQKDNDTGKEMARRLGSEAQMKGLSKVYIPLDPEAPQSAREPDKFQRVALTVTEALELAQQAAAPMLDMMITKDATNQEANADLIVGGTVVKEKVPVSFLLWLDGWLDEWRVKQIAILPVLNPTMRWHPDNSRSGLWLGDTERVPRFLKKWTSLKLHDGNEKFKPEAQAIQDEVLVGHYDTVPMSGSITEDRKRQLMANVETLQAAVKDAIARANRTTAVETEIGQTLMGLLLA